MCYVPASDPAYRHALKWRLILSWLLAVVVPLGFWLSAGSSASMAVTGDVPRPLGLPHCLLWLGPWISVLAGVLLSPQEWFRLLAGPVMWLVLLVNQCCLYARGIQLRSAVGELQFGLGHSVHGEMVLEAIIAVAVILAGLSPLGRLNQPELPPSDEESSAGDPTQEEWQSLSLRERDLLLGL